MKLWQKILVGALCITMAGIVTTAVVGAIVSNNMKAMELALGTAGEEEKLCDQKMYITLNDGVMVSSIESTCDCGETKLTNISRTKGKAENIVAAIKCEEAFFIMEANEYKQITREELLNMIATYEFAELDT